MEYGTSADLSGFVSAGDQATSTWVGRTAVGPAVKPGQTSHKKGIKEGEVLACRNQRGRR